MMMMIVLIPINSGSVPSSESLCAQILYSRFEIIGGLCSHLLLFFIETKNMLKIKAVSSRSHLFLAYIYTRVLLHIYECINAEI